MKEQTGKKFSKMLQPIGIGFLSSWSHLLYNARIQTHNGDIILSITNKMQHYRIFFIAVNALHVSGGFSVHHQELKTVHTASGICQTCLLLPLAWVCWNNSPTLLGTVWYEGSCFTATFIPYGAKQQRSETQPATSTGHYSICCKNLSLALLKMGKHLPETCWADLGDQ
jgi:hypothetical protein